MQERAEGARAALAVRKEPAERAPTAELLARAFVADPVLCHAEPDARRRASWVVLLYRSLLRYSTVAGGVEVVDGKAAALWLQNETQPSFWRGLLYGSPRIMWALGWRAAWRCMRHEAWCAARVRALGFERYGYVWLLGVEPVLQRCGYGRRALAVALEAMRQRGHEICLLKTETRANVDFYRERGFVLVDEQLVPATQLRYWLFRYSLLPPAPR